jgi:predicted dithiol-disulfide oxidoreductase (DUF899 family)
MEKITMNLPPIVSKEKWEAAVEAFREKEKAATRARDALAAERRRLPRLAIEKDYTFTGPRGEVNFAGLFDGRRQLLLYHFMFGPNANAGCPGCSMFIDNVGHLEHLHARDITFVAVSRAPIEKIEAYRKRMGWTIPWFSSFGTDFSYDFGLGYKEPKVGEDQDGEMFALSALLHEGGKIYRTYVTNRRGLEGLNTWTFLDLAPFGREEEWEDSPEGYPQTKPYQWWRRHDEYGK